MKSPSAAPPAAREEASSTYLTDGARLYRTVQLGRPGAAEELVGLEDCRSLEVLMIPVRELSALGLRPVIPAPPE